MKLYINLENTGYGEIYVEANGSFFPCEHWEDFCVTVLDGWCSDLNYAQKNARNEFELVFMEGDYYLKGYKQDDRLTIMGVKGSEKDFNPSNGTVLFTEKLRYAEFENIIFDQSKKVLLSMRESHSKDAHLQHLENEINYFDSRNTHSPSRIIQ